METGCDAAAAADFVAVDAADAADCCCFHQRKMMRQAVRVAPCLASLPLAAGPGGTGWPRGEAPSTAGCGCGGGPRNVIRMKVAISTRTPCSWRASALLSRKSSSKRARGFGSRGARSGSWSRILVRAFCFRSSF